MSKGRLRCCGSPLFLKSKYSSGYHLVLTKSQDTETSETGMNETTASTENKASRQEGMSRNIARLIKKIIPEAKLNEDLNSEVSFVLPAEQTSKFSELFETLEENKESLRIDNIGISISTLEDVFLKYLSFFYP